MCIYTHTLYIYIYAIYVPIKWIYVKVRKTISPSYTCVHMPTHICMLTHTHALTYIHACIHVCAHTCALAKIHVHTHMYAFTQYANPTSTLCLNFSYYHPARL